MNQVWHGARRVEIMGRVRHLHTLGDRALFEFIELLAQDPLMTEYIEEFLYDFTKIERRTIEAVGGVTELKPPIAAVPNTNDDDETGTDGR